MPTEMGSISYKNYCPKDDNKSIYTDDFFRSIYKQNTVIKSYSREYIPLE